VTPSPFAKDAARICREIAKIRDEDPMCSITSELSLVSCDSFLDAELSGLEIPDRPMPDFLASEEHPVTLKLLMVRLFHCVITLSERGFLFKNIFR